MLRGAGARASRKGAATNRRRKRNAGRTSRAYVSKWTSSEDQHPPFLPLHEAHERTTRVAHVATTLLERDGSCDA
jgi:hypothetical protein